MTRTNAHGQPIGETVDWSPRPRPAPVTLEGRLARIEPVSQAHVPGLYAALCGPEDDSLWTYMRQERATSQEELAAHVAGAIRDPAAVTFAILVESAPVGLASLLRIDPGNGSVELGSIVLARSLQRTRAATEAMALFARHVFDDLGYRRYEWKCDSLNAPSRRAALRLGFAEEGTFRNALVYKSRSRDTTWFSVTDSEWPLVREALGEWLDDGNFDSEGRQRRSLQELRRAVYAN